MNSRRLVSVPSRIVLAAIAACVSFTVVSPVSPAAAVGASTLYVAASGSVGAGTSCASPGYVGSTETPIQAAINAASAGDTVFVCAGTYNINPRLTITKNLTFRGASEQTSILDGGDASQILYIPNQGSVYTVAVSNFTFRHGAAVDESRRNDQGECYNGLNCGGAIYARGSGTLDLSDSYFHDNQSQFAGAVIIVEPKATNTIKNSTFVHNSTLIDAGAILALGDAGGQTIMDRLTVVNNYIAAGPESRDVTAISANFGWGTLSNSTLIDNVEHPDGLVPTQVYGGGLTVKNTIIATSAPTDVRACNYVTMDSGNLITGASQNSCVTFGSYPPGTAGASSIVTWDQLKLGTLGYHGYSTKTVPLLAGSVALNYWDGVDCAGSDQRGISVPQGSKCDAGAYERHASQSLNTPTTWSYGSATLDRGPATTFPVTTGSTDPAGRGVTYSSETSSVCTVNASTGTITAVSNGTCTITAAGEQYLLRDADTRSVSVTITGTPGVTTTTTAPTTTTTVSPTTTGASPTTTVASAVTTVASTATTVASSATTVTAGGTATGASTATSGGATTTTVKSTATTVATTATGDVSPTAPATTAPATTTTTTVPAPDAPSAAPGEAAATLDGEIVDATVARANNALVIDSGDIEVSVYGVTETGERVALDGDGNLVLQAGDSVAVEGSGYAPGSEVELWLRSTPVQLGIRTADAEGKIAGSFTVPATIEKGNHRVLFSGSTKSGSESVVGVGVRVGSYDKVGGVNRGLIAGVIVVAVILALVIPTSTRRRRRAAMHG